MSWRYRIDLGLVAMGYLRSADGRWRHVPGLDVLARSAQQHGVRFVWGAPRGDRPGCAYVWRQEVVLAPRIFDGPGWAIRDVWAHELSHCLVGPCCRRARAWQEWCFQSVVGLPDECAAA